MPMNVPPNSTAPASAATLFPVPAQAIPAACSNNAATSSAG